MADGILNQPFGLNIKVPTRTIEQVKQTAEGTVSGLWEPLFGFIEDNQSVFTGSVANQIEKYNLMMFNIGAELRKAEGPVTFNVKG